MQITVKDFDLTQTLRCGQMFRYSMELDGSFTIVAKGRQLRLKQEDDCLSLSCDKEEYQEIWAEYLDMKTDYGDLKDRLYKGDSRIRPALISKGGIHILKQDPFEMLITFILSQNKNMPAIMQLVEEISKTYGTYIDEGNGYYIFPTPVQLAHVSEEDFRALKVGFRAPYLVDAIDKVNHGAVDLEALSDMSLLKAKEQLLTIKGVGSKVADCILLFGYHKLDTFPMDVWVKRIMSQLYFKGETVSDKEMLEKAKKRFGRYRGLAQQYLFHYYQSGEKG